MAAKFRRSTRSTTKCSELVSVLPTRAQLLHRKETKAADRLTPLPLDMLNEILQYLDPADLLHLARVNKTFRKYLLSRSVAQLWQNALEHVDGLPACPEWLSPPAYTNLAFENICHKCGKSGTKAVYWQFAARYCPVCRNTMLMKCSDDESCPFGESCDEQIIAHVHDRTSDAHYHHLPEVKEYEETSEFLTVDETVQWRERLISKMEFAAVCGDWEERCAEERADEREAIRQRRLEAIVEKLRDMGWGEELDYMGANYFPLSEQPDVRRPHELTERSWANIRPRIVKYMEGNKQFRISEERHTILRTRCEVFVHVYLEWLREHPGKRELPRPSELLRREEIVKLIEQPNDIEVADAAFAPFRETFCEWTNEWQRDCEEQLEEVVQRSSAFKDQLSADVDLLSLASVVFDCKGCARYEGSAPLLPPLPPYSAAHECLAAAAEIGSERDPVSRAILAGAPHASGDIDLGYLPWSTKGLSIGVWHRRACEVIRAAGPDPMVATREEMDALDVRFWCHTCLEGCCKVKRQVMNWRDANRAGVRCGKRTIDIRRDMTRILYIFV